MGDKLSKMKIDQLLRSVCLPTTLTAMTAVMLLAGCGQKGPLTLPKDKPAAVAPAAPPAGSAPAR